MSSTLQSLSWQSIRSSFTATFTSSEALCLTINGADKSPTRSRLVLPSFHTLISSFHNTSAERRHDRLLFPAVEDKGRCSLIRFNCPTAQGNSWVAHFSSARLYKHFSAFIKATGCKDLPKTFFLFEGGVNTPHVPLLQRGEEDITASQPKPLTVHPHQVIHQRGLFKTTGGHLFRSPTLSSS